MLFSSFCTGVRPLMLCACVLQLAGCATALSPAESRVIAAKTYVVTGASSGLGRGVALRLATLRANVVLAARRGDVLEEVAAQVRAAGGSALAVPTDVSQADAVEQLAQAALTRFGRIDVWINNAGVGAIGRFDRIPLVDHARVIDVNLKGVIYGSHVALRQFKRQGGGTLINIGSIESEVPLANHASYSASKAAVLSLGRALNEELRLAGARSIAVSTVMPWATDTPFFQTAANYSGGTLRMPAMDDPARAVETIVRASLYPREEVRVGWKGPMAALSHWLAPDVTERVSASIVQRWQFDTAPPAAPTSGNLHRPAPGPMGVDGGVRARMAREDAHRTGRAAEP
jgi:short-subunit dehydrogenase